MASLYRGIGLALVSSLVALPVAAFAHDGRHSGNRTARTQTASKTRSVSMASGLPNYYDRLTATDNYREVHRKGQHSADQHGGSTGHLPATDPATDGTEVVGKLRLVTDEPGRISDVSANKGYAYLGHYYEPKCTTGGVSIVDARDPAAPVKLGFVKSHTDSYVSEGVQALSITTPSYSGDLLLYNNESCDKNGIGGVSIVDVSNPREPRKLVEGAGDFTVRNGANTAGRSRRHANETHSVMAWDAGDKAYAIIVDDEEELDVDILDITDPRRPKLIRETGFPEWNNVSVEGLGSDVFLHDVDVRKEGNDWIAILSYWDAGYVKLNVNDPANPFVLDESDFAATDPEFPGFSPPEGNGHQSFYDRSGDYIVGTDEDFAPFRTTPFTIASGPNAGAYPSASIGGGGGPANLPDRKLNGPTTYGGYGCPTSAPIPPPPTTALLAGEERIVVLQRGPSGDPSAPEVACFPGEKAATAIQAGYDAVVLTNRHLGSEGADEPSCGSGAFPEGPPIPAVCTTHKAMHDLFGTTPAYDSGYTSGTEPALGAPGAKVSIEAVFDGWGYVHLFDADTLNELDTYAVEETKLEANAIGKGDLSVHETEADPLQNGLMYYSYYSAGFRATRIVDNKLVEVAKFIDEGGNNIWGLTPIVDPRDANESVVLLSDRDYGLYVVKLDPSETD